MRNYRENQIRRMLRPVGTQSFHNRAMVPADGPLQNDQKLRSEARPPPPQDLVVDVLNTESGSPANQVQRIKQLLDIEETDLPGIFLPGERFLESVSGALMPPARVMINDG